MKHIKWTLQEICNELKFIPRRKIRKIELPKIEYCGLTICLNPDFDRKTYYNI